MFKKKETVQEVLDLWNKTDWESYEGEKYTIVKTTKSPDIKAKIIIHDNTRAEYEVESKKHGSCFRGEVLSTWGFNEYEKTQLEKIIELYNKSPLLRFLTKINKCLKYVNKIQQ